MVVILHRIRTDFDKYQIYGNWRRKTITFKYLILFYNRNTLLFSWLLNGRGRGRYMYHALAHKCSIRNNVGNVGKEKVPGRQDSSGRHFKTNHNGLANHYKNNSSQTLPRWLTKERTEPNAPSPSDRLSFNSKSKYKFLSGTQHNSRHISNDNRRTNHTCENLKGESESARVKENEKKKKVILHCLIKCSHK